ncbi:MAG: CDP-alcohol phosphatidyltransferase family protein [Planctomycetales bacterium]|nr:CDP-alcohol phosphatidyltransferase family protein [Planctomycetales bacterium]
MSAKGTSARSRRLRTRRAVAAMLPNLLTLGNAACGFGAIVHVGGIALPPPAVPPAPPPDPIHAILTHPNVWTACTLIFIAMVFDVLDGRVARLTRQTSDLGAQLDSLADAITFGVAPAFLVWKVMWLVPAGPPVHVGSRLTWALSLLYMGCAVLRLARFNVETAPDDRHDMFRGLPTPGAAGVVASLFLLFHEAAGTLRDWNLLPVLVWLLPALVPALGLLMVSSFPYLHLLTWVFRGKKPFTSLVGLVFAILIAVQEPTLALAAGFVSYAATGPLTAAWRWLRARRAPASAVGPAPGPAPVPQV